MAPTPSLLNWLLLLCLISPALAQPQAIPSEPPIVIETAVPEPLLPWLPWVTRDLEHLACPPGPTGLRICAWPGRLSLGYDRDGALFSQNWRLYAPAQVPLPGDHASWPDGVSVDGQPALVYPRGGRPGLWLEAGHHTVTGVLSWQRVPNTLTVPEGTSSVWLSGPDGRPAPARWTRDGQVWLGAGPPADVVPEDRLSLRLYRRLIDELPPRLETLLVLEVAGRTREQLLTGLLPQSLVAVELNSPLPARWEGDQGLRLTLRPGHWRVTLTARGDSTTPLESIGPTSNSPAPDGEVWAFQARPELRRVTVSGGAVLDPSSTGLPGEWQSLPAYLLLAGEQLTFATEQRGSPLPPDNRLTLQRELWRDLDGPGWTFRDRIGGELNRHWRLEAGAALELGRAVAGGEPRVLTRLGEDGQEGVELRRHRLQLLAEGRLAPDAELPANGWNETMSDVGLRLHLPPGWQLLHVSGARVGDSWTVRWSTLDLFLLIVLAYGAWRLWGPLWAVLLGAVLVLTLQAPAAVWPWVLLLVAAGLLRALRGRTRLRRAAGWLRAFALVALVLTAVPFLAGELRLGLYPQLDRPVMGPIAAEKAALEDFAAGAPRSAAPLPGALEQELALRSQQAASEPVAPPPRFDPDAQIPTGPGVPDWQGRVHSLSWTGPVVAEQTFAVVLLS
ncbi:MAG: hypothetical protein R3310_08635, partial [Candidatus Competibacteraceae bacterium]|nr:hypothetical protein [Candidatus Competibacteraceae bacterium]